PRALRRAVPPSQGRRADAGARRRPRRRGAGGRHRARLGRGGPDGQDRPRGPQGADGPLVAVRDERLGPHAPRGRGGRAGGRDLRRDDARARLLPLRRGASRGRGAARLPPLRSPRREVLSRGPFPLHAPAQRRRRPPRLPRGARPGGRRVNILHLEDEPWDSGIAHYAVTLAAEQARRGHRVALWGVTGSPLVKAAADKGLPTRTWLPGPSGWLEIPSLRKA